MMKCRTAAPLILFALALGACARGRGREESSAAPPKTADVAKARGAETRHLRHAAAPPAEATSARPTTPPPQAADASKEGGTGTRAKGNAGAVVAARPDGAGYGAGYGRLGGTHATQPYPARRAVKGFGAMGNMAAPAEFNTENYAHTASNEFLRVSEHPLSTFAADVDTASYSNARRFLANSEAVPKDAIRVEEWLNYFAYDYRAPSEDQPFAVNAEVSACPWDPSHKLLRIGLKGRPIAEERVPPRNLVFLLDVSGSMNSSDKLPLLKSGLSLLARQLRPQDSIAMVVYAGSSGLVLPATSGNANQRAALDALGRLEAGGSTNGGDGIRLAYSVAEQHFIKDGINRVILATDGDFNVGTTSEGELVRLIEDKRKSGVFLTVLGFGQGNLKDATMESLADKGNGNYAYIDSLYEAKKVLVREAGATLVAIAKDVKLQLEWNPTRAASYRLVGYENRVLAAQDFNDDKKDAGEIGAGHTVTALYEIVPPGAAGNGAARVDPLKYQRAGSPSAAAAGPELVTVKIRYKQPNSETSTLLQEVVLDSDAPFERASVDHRFAVGVADAALVLREAPGMSGATLAQARDIAAGALGADLSGDRHEFIAMLDRAATLRAGQRPAAAK